MYPRLKLLQWIAPPVLPVWRSRVPRLLQAAEMIGNGNFLAKAIPSELTD
jgi:hypothetical protein